MRDPLIPVPARLRESRNEGGGVRTLFFDWSNVGGLRPGMGFKIAVYGFGETDAWVSEIGEDNVGLAIWDRDRVSHRIGLIPEGQWLGLRGPHGNGFPLEDWPKGRIGLFTMDLGLVAMRPLVNALLAQGREVFLGHVTSNHKDVVLGAALERAEAAGVSVMLSALDEAGTRPLEEILDKGILAPKVLANLGGAAVAGPREFERVVVKQLEGTQTRDKDIHILVNRNRTSGAGLSNQDLVGQVNIWQAGPVFSLDKLRDLADDVL